MSRKVDSPRRILALSFSSGAGVFFAGYVFCLLYTTSFSVMGVQSRELEDMVFSSFKWLIISSQMKIILCYILIGGAAGAAMGYCMYLYADLRNRVFFVREILRGSSFYGLAVALAFFLYDAALHPALYNEYLYARGGIARYIQIALTDGIPISVLRVFRAAMCVVAIPIGMKALLLVSEAVRKFFAAAPAYARRGILIVCIMAFGIYFFQGTRNEGPNLIIIASDSFRYDRVSAFGGRSGLTPNIDALAGDGFSFHDFHVQLPRTFPSWYCLFSGKYPAQHGVRHMFPRRDEIARADAGLPSLLAKNGYTTSVVADYAGDIFSRMNCFQRVNAPGFSFATLIQQRSLEIQCMLLPFLQNRAGRFAFPELRAFAHNSDPEFLKNDVIRELERLSGTKKFFFTIFCSTTHFPYASPYPWYKQYAEKEYRGEYKYLKINDPTKSSVISDADKQQIAGLFDGACASIDDAVGEITAWLKKNGLYDNSIIVFTADHGENLYDDGLDLGHGEHFRGEYATHVPCIIKFHDAYKKHVAVAGYNGIVEQVDFMPTIMDILKLSARDDAAGISFRPVIEGRQAKIPRVAFSETGIWFVDTGDQFFQKQRIRYPDVSVLCRLEEPDNQVVLKEEYDDLITIAKHRAVFNETHKLIYIPTREGARYELVRRGDKGHSNVYARRGREFHELYGYLCRYMKQYENMKLINGMFIPRSEENEEKE